MTKGKSPIMAQMEKIFRHTRANSFGTRARYESSCRNFIGFIDGKFKMKNLRNLQDKHVVAYIQYRQSEGISSKTLKNDLGAIRYMHDMIPNVKHEISDNKNLKNSFSVVLDKTPAIRGNRAWTEDEYSEMQGFVSDMATSARRGAETAADVRDVMQLAKTMGLRVTEAIAISRVQAEQALKSGVYQVKGEAKNGKWRQVSLSDEGRRVLEYRIKNLERGGRLFIRPDEKTHVAVNRVEKFMQNNSKRFETTEGQINRMYEGKYNTLTYHGLRYNYIQSRMLEETENGCPILKAAMVITKEVGHERIEVLNVYLSGSTFKV